MFDAGQVAAEALERGEDPLETMVGQLVGYGSACWDNLEGAGVFESERAAAATESAVEWLRSRVVRLEAGDRLVIAGAPGEQVPVLREQLERWEAEGRGPLVVADELRVFVVRGGTVEVAGQVGAARRHDSTRCPKCHRPDDHHPHNGCPGRCEVALAAEAGR